MSKLSVFARINSRFIASHAFAATSPLARARRASSTSSSTRARVSASALAAAVCRRPSSSTRAASALHLCASARARASRAHRQSKASSSTVTSRASRLDVCIVHALRVDPPRATRYAAMTFHIPRAVAKKFFFRFAHESLLTRVAAPYLAPHAPSRTTARVDERRVKASTSRAHRARVRERTRASRRRRAALTSPKVSTGHALFRGVRAHQLRSECVRARAR